VRKLGDLGFDEGGALLIKRALRLLTPGEQISVSGSAPDLELHLRSWCRAEGHVLQWSGMGDVQALFMGFVSLLALIDFIANFPQTCFGHFLGLGRNWERILT
jgi:hypothetical protein